VKCLEWKRVITNRLYNLTKYVFIHTMKEKYRII